MHDRLSPGSTSTSTGRRQEELEAPKGASDRQVQLPVANEPRTRRSTAAPPDSAREMDRELEKLHATVVQHVSARRDAGVPVERVLVEAKGLARRVSVRRKTVPTDDGVMTRVVGWTITAYFDDPALRNVPRFY